jgi:mono/diheme cytochrome c family protein
LLLGALVGCWKDDMVSPREQLIARGTYLVEHVSLCVDCHTPRDSTGALDNTRKLAGSFFADIVPNDDSLGAIWAPNLTPDSTGLRNWSDAQIKEAFLNGRDEHGGALFPIMPYWVYHNMTAGDAEAVVAFLRNLPAVRNEIPERQPLGFPYDTPASPIPVSRIPQTTLAVNNANYASAVRGRYLAGLAGVCIDCHTIDSGDQTPGAVPVNLDSLYAGGRGFEIGFPFPDVVYSANITPDSTGIDHDTPEQIRAVLLQGVDHHGEQICPPMPVGPTGGLGGLTLQDALDIANYVKTIPPLHHLVTDCEYPTIPKPAAGPTMRPSRQVGR